jgi:peptide/nickel transport system permease protein
VAPRLAGIRRTLRQPGSYRILAGGCLVLLLALATLTGEAWTDWEADEMDLENILVPPEPAWLKRLLATEEGLRLHERNKAGIRPAPGAPAREDAEDGDELDFLSPSEPGSGTGEGGAGALDAGTSLGGDAPAAEEAPVLARLEDEDEELDMLEAAGAGTPGSPSGGKDTASRVQDSASGSPGTAAGGSDGASGATGASTDGADGSGTGNGPEASQPEDGAAAPRRPHYLGTDKNGRDMLALLAAGARTCFAPGLVTCSVALGLGVPLGLLAGYYGGRFRKLVGVLNGTVLSLPRLVLILVVICALEPNVYYTMAVLGATLVPRVSELIATRVRILSNMGFILAAKEAALSDFKILYRHLFWYQNRAVFFIQFSLIMAESILVETTLSYLQFGTKPPEVSWGNIIEGSQMSFFSGFYWITAFPAAAIILAILGFFYLGDGLNARLAWREGR